MFMKKNLNILILLLGSVFIQIFLTRNIICFPDIILLVVVFAGIFLGAGSGAWVGITAGFLRGCFSCGTIFLDISLFLIIGINSSFLAEKFYKYNPVVQSFISGAAIFITITGRTLYFNVAGGNPVSILSPYAANWKMIGITILLSPIFFAFAKKIVKINGES